MPEEEKRDSKEGNLEKMKEVAGLGLVFIAITGLYVADRLFDNFQKAKKMYWDFRGIEYDDFSEEYGLDYKKKNKSG